MLEVVNFSSITNSDLDLVDRLAILRLSELKELGELNPQKLDFYKRQILESIEEGYDYVMAQIQNNTPLGYCMGETQERQNYRIYRTAGLYVRPQYRGEGIAKKLKEIQIQRARELECEIIESSTSSDNQVAIHLLRKLGFEINSSQTHNGVVGIMRL